MKLRGLSVRFPFAQLLVQGVKTAELRGWELPEPGRYIIQVATQSFLNRLLPEFGEAVARMPPELRKARRCIIGAVEFWKCEPVAEAHRKAACADISSFKFAWLARNPVIFSEFTPFNGAQKHMPVNSDILPESSRQALGLS